MHPAIRRPADNHDFTIDRDALYCPPDEDQTRQEERRNTEISTILDQHGYIPYYNQQPEYGRDLDYDVDLLNAHTAIEQAHEAYDALPSRLHQRYPDFASFMAAIYDGSLHIAPKPDAEVPSAPDPGPPSPAE